MCTYAASARRNPRFPTKGTKSIRNRLDRVEGLLKGTNQGTEISSSNPYLSSDYSPTKGTLTPPSTIAADNGDDDGAGVSPPEQEVISFSTSVFDPNRLMMHVVAKL